MLEVFCCLFDGILRILEGVSSSQLMDLHLILDLTKIQKYYKMSHVMRKPDFCICENKGVDQLHAAGQRLSTS